MTSQKKNKTYKDTISSELIKLLLKNRPERFRKHFIISGHVPFRQWAENVRFGDKLPRGKFFRRYDRIIRQLLVMPMLPSRPLTKNKFQYRKERIN